MKKIEFLGIRLSPQLTRAIERQRQRMSKAAGAEVKTSAAARALIEAGIKAMQRDRAA